MSDRHNVETEPRSLIPVVLLFVGIFVVGFLIFM